MNKTQLVDSVAQITGLSKVDALRAVEATFDTITKTLAMKEQVVLVGFGSFGVKKRAARIGRDPRTGGALQIPEAMVAFFKAGKALKDAVNESAEEEVAGG